MFGAIIGDMVGSVYEFDNLRSKDFPFFRSDCWPTDDSIMTIAVMQALLETDGKVKGLAEKTVEWMQKIGRQYPNCGYGGRFWDWVFDSDPKPYGSYGNGAAMRVSACGWAARTLEEAKALSYAVTAVSHDHPEGLRGAEATACAVFLANDGRSKEEIRAFIEERYCDLDFTIDGIRGTYEFNESCQGTVPQAIESFLESESFEDAIRIAISVGGDSDTLAAITGSIAEAYYGIPAALREQAEKQFRFGYLTHYPAATATKDPDLLSVVEAFERKYGRYVRRKNVRAILEKEEAHAGMLPVGLDRIDPSEVVIVIDAVCGAMGISGAIELYSIHEGEVLFFSDNKAGCGCDFDEIVRRFPEGIRYVDGILRFDKEKWKLFGGGTGNRFLIRRALFDELQKRKEKVTLRNYRSIVYVAEQLLLETAGKGVNTDGQRIQHGELQKGKADLLDP